MKKEDKKEEQTFEDIQKEVASLKEQLTPKVEKKEDTLMKDMLAVIKLQNDKLTNLENTINGVGTTKQVITPIKEEKEEVVKEKEEIKPFDITKLLKNK